MAEHLTHEQGTVQVEEVADGRRRITVAPASPDLFIPVSSCETAYCRPLIELILRHKGPLWLCDEILREEGAGWVQASLEMAICAHLDPEDHKGVEILDFGCGSGASSMHLARIFPTARIHGVDLNANLLEVAEARAEHYGLRGVEFTASPDPERLPEQVGRMDMVCLHALYEHLLPEERRGLLPQLWSLLPPGGLMILVETPYRWFPWERHTSGLPLVNYLPDRAALVCVRALSARVERDSSWSDLLRGGIRGGSPREILSILKQSGDGRPVLLRPSRNGIGDAIDLWQAIRASKPDVKAPSPLLRSTISALKLLYRLTGVAMVPNISLVIKKEP